MLYLFSKQIFNWKEITFSKSLQKQILNTASVVHQPAGSSVVVGRGGAGWSGLVVSHQGASVAGGLGGRVVGSGRLLVPHQGFSVEVVLVWPWVDSSV